MPTLRIRVYNVLFGDAILLTVPDEDEHGRTVTLQVLFDVGNALAGAGGDDTVFEPVLKDIQHELDGKPIDLYVMTHEHMDHIQGLLYGSRKLGIEMKARHVWMTASSEPDYYDRFPEARKQRSLALSAYEDVEKFFAAHPAALSEEVSTLLAINNPRASKDCVDFIRDRAPRAPLYVHRTADIAGHHPFRRTRIRVLAPEEDTSVYYGRLGPRTLGPMVADANPIAIPEAGLTPPAGVSAGHFFDLIRFRSRGMSGNLLQIDKAANNSSVVIEFEWEGWTLLFAADAEEKSWAIMDRNDLLRPAHFLKVSHHGSQNGTPPAVTAKVMPAAPADDRRRVAVVSTREGAYPGVPDQATLDMLAARATLHDTRDYPPGGWIDVTFDA